MQSMMRAAALVGAYNVTILDVPKPTIENGTDAIVRITSSAICGSDLHGYHQGGIASPDQPLRLGHEAIGYIEELGDSVEFLSVWDWVVVPFVYDAGHYQYDPLVDPVLSASEGMQAEYARVPYADHTLMPVPINGSANASTIYDYLFMSDILATGWAVLDYAEMQHGDTVAIFGAGPVGQMAVLSAEVRGAPKIYIIDQVQERLDLAAANGAILINFLDVDPVETLRQLEPDGVARVADCVGWEAEDSQGNVNSTIVLHQAGEVVAPWGGIGVVGIYGDGDQEQTIDMRSIFRRGFSVRGGLSIPLDVGREMLNLISSGRLHPGSIVSAVIDIEETPENYQRFSRREEVKVVIDFP